MTAATERDKSYDIAKDITVASAVTAATAMLTSRFLTAAIVIS